MNLLFLNSIEKETFGGMEEWIRLVAHGLRARGHSSLVAGRLNSEFLRRVAKSGVETISLDISGDFNPVTIAGLRRLLQQRQIDLVCVNFNKDVRLGGLAAKLAGSIPVVWSVGLDITSSSWTNRKLTPRLIDSVIVPSESLKRQITARGYIDRGKVSVIPIGIEDDSRAMKSSEAARKLRSELNLSAETLIAVTVGRFVEQKGHAILIDALPDIVARIPNARFLFLGDGPLAPVIRSRAAALGVLDYLIFGGMRDDVMPALSGSDMMIHPSIEEPFGIALLEGMRSGLPIVASAVGGIPEVAGEGECMTLVEPRNPQALAKAVVATLADSGRAEGMGLIGRRRFEHHFTVRTMIDRIEDCFIRTTEAAPHNG